MGSHSRYICGQNFDFAGFIPLVREVYYVMEREDYYLPRRLPFCVFQHAMTEALTAHMIQESRFTIPGLQSIGMLVPFSEMTIPYPIYEYIIGIGANMTPGGQKVHWNYPDAAIPQQTIEGPNPCRSGSFGIPTAANHNAYECYISPYITSELVKQQAKVTEDTKNFDWDPFPKGWLPEDCKVNGNLLGYSRLEPFRYETANACNKCDFADHNGVNGLLCHSYYGFSLSSLTVGSLKTIKSVQMKFNTRNKTSKNNAAFIFSEFCDSEGKEIVLYDKPSTKYSPFSFNENAENRSSRFAYKRRRNKEAPGAFALCNGNLLDGWLDTINDNFECTGSFGLQQQYKDRKSLREENHMAVSNWSHINSWLQKTFLTKQSMSYANYQ